MRGAWKVEAGGINGSVRPTNDIDRLGIPAAGFIAEQSCNVEADRELLGQSSQWV